MTSVTTSDHIWAVFASCKHEHFSCVAEGGYTCGVARAPYTDENQAAHGGMHYVMECSLCGARRDELRNGNHVEYGVWSINHTLAENAKAAVAAARERWLDSPEGQQALSDLLDDLREIEARADARAAAARSDWLHDAAAVDRHIDRLNAEIVALGNSDTANRRRRALRSAIAQIQRERALSSPAPSTPASSTPDAPPGVDRS